MTNRQSLQREEFNSSKMGESAVFPPIVGFTTRLKLPESKRRRKRADSVPDTPRQKSEEELREEAAWNQVEETGKPVVFDQHLLIPEGMSVWQAIEFLPDAVREQTKAALGAKVSEAWQMIFNSTEERIRKNAEEKGELERYNSFPPHIKHALTESVVREQWGFPEIPLEELIHKWENPPQEEESKPPPHKKKKRPKETHKPPSFESRFAVDSNETTRQSIASLSQPPPDASRNAPERTPSQSQTTPTGATALEWNRQHRYFLLKRLDQIWGYLDSEEQQAVQEILNRRIGKEEIDQIDEIVKGVEWVRRLQK